MPTPIIILPIHTIEQARALAGLIRAYLDGQAPDTNDGADWKPDPDLAGIAALYAHLDAGIAEATAPAARTVKVRVLRAIKSDLPRLVVALLHVAPGIYDAEINPLGALSIRTPGGLLGIKPGEFERL